MILKNYKFPDNRYYFNKYFTFRSYKYLILKINHNSENTLIIRLHITPIRQIHKQIFIQIK